jgi:hypothetical protein
MAYTVLQEEQHIRMLQQYLSQLGLPEKEQRIYLALAELGVQPASSIARRVKMDRVTTYKHLKRLTTLGLVKVYYTHAIQHFGVESPEAIEKLLKEREESIKGMLSDFPLIDKQIKALESDEPVIPRVQVFEGQSGIQSCFRDILHELGVQGVRQIRMLSTNTFSEKLGNVPLSKFTSEFLVAIKKKRIDMDVLEATGTLIPERMEHRLTAELNPEKLPAAGGATHIFLAGTAVYLLTFKETPIGLKIKQQEMAHVFHFLFDMMKKSA